MFSSRGKLNRLEPSPELQEALLKAINESLPSISFSPDRKVIEAN
tara:strand:- start:4966 stop:5100 length:135 start_codon:yes stop_codon:yes gene_type:complete